MKPTKRRSDPLGRSTTRHRYSRYLLSLAIAITGSVWPIQARSIEPILDTPPRPHPSSRPSSITPEAPAAGAARVVFVRGDSHGGVVPVPTRAAALRIANTD
jgi:hypothetical protein